MLRFSASVGGLAVRGLFMTVSPKLAALITVSDVVGPNCSINSNARFSRD